MVLSVFSSEVVLPSGDGRVNREFTVRAVAPSDGNIAQRFSKRCDLNTDKYHEFVAKANQAIQSMNDAQHADIFACVRHGNRVRAEELIREDRTRVNALDEFGNTPLIIAAQNNQVGIAEFLVLHGADVDARNCKGNTALHFATKYGYAEMQRRLVEEWKANTTIRNTRWLLSADGINHN